MIYLPDTNACIALLRQKHPPLISRWMAARPEDIALCSIVVYELRYGAERASDPVKEQQKLDFFFGPLRSLAFDDKCARRCAEIRRALECRGTPIGPHDLQIAAIALEYDLTLVTHNVKEFRLVESLKLEDWEI